MQFLITLDFLLVLTLDPPLKLSKVCINLIVSITAIMYLHASVLQKACYCCPTSELYYCHPAKAGLLLSMSHFQMFFPLLTSF